jgi:hypothetical protein
MTEPERWDGESEELLRRALVDEGSGAAVALQVLGLPVAEAVTVIFHGRRDLGTLETFVAAGGRQAGEAVRRDELLRVPCSLDLGDAEDRDEAERLYQEQARVLRDAIEAADTVLRVWEEPLLDLAEGRVLVDRSVVLDVTLPAHRLLPVALVAPDQQLVVTPVCGARTLAEGRPPLGIACAQQGVARVYPLPDDPERCLADFVALSSNRAHELAAQLEQQEASVERFLELNGGDEPHA